MYIKEKTVRRGSSDFVSLPEEVLSDIICSGASVELFGAIWTKAHVSMTQKKAHRETRLLAFDNPTEFEGPPFSLLWKKKATLKTVAAGRFLHF